MNAEELAIDPVAAAHRLLGEHWLGAGRGARFLLGLVVSTGVGGGLVLSAEWVNRWHLR